MKNRLIIGNKNYSSWSLRPWLLLKVKGIDFEELRIPLFEADSKAKLAPYSPSGKVPVFESGPIKIWESLAICEYIAETWPHKHCWPKEPAERAHARAISNEMHSSFETMRRLLPMNSRRSVQYVIRDAALEADIRRINAIWGECLREYAGPFLFGKDFTIADAMYAPVVLRFNTYNIGVNAAVRKYMQTILGLPELQQWMADARSEKEVIAMNEIQI
jgi:glutathione S-transferase